jgi:hypothetical protein
MSEHLSRALRPVVIEIPLKTGVQFALEKFVDSDGELLLKVNLASLFDFDVTLTIDDYGTLGKLLVVLSQAQEEELERIKAGSKRARGERTRTQSAVKQPTIAERSRKRRRRNPK